MRTAPAPDEISWWLRLRQLWKDKPETLTCFADGGLAALDTAGFEAWEANPLLDLRPLDLRDIPGVGGGDPW